MTPRTNQQLSPNFHEIGWSGFQRLCRDLFSKEPAISTASVYGTQGQEQRGIDVLAQVNPAGHEVGQCKCVAAFSVRGIQSASDEFFKHWEHWKDRDIRRFILFLACDAERTELQDAKMQQRERFAKYKIKYELWDGATIKRKLEPHREIARAYIGSEEIIASICGPISEVPDVLADRAIANRRLGIMATELENIRGTELEELRELSRAGEQSKALDGVISIKLSPTWEEYAATFRSRVLRFEAMLRLNLRQDTNVIAELIEEARQLNPGGDFQTIDAYLAYCRRDRSAALALVRDPKTIGARNLRWGFLLENGEVEAFEQETTTTAFPRDAETHRMMALAALLRGNITSAKVFAEQALAEVPTWKDTRLVKATVDYFSAISPASNTSKRLGWAVPVNWAYIKRDAIAIESLRSAEVVFAQWSRHPDSSPAERENFSIWRLACLACIDSSQLEAETLARQLLVEYPDSYGVIAWALHRGFSFEHDAAEKALRKRISQEPQNPDAWMTLWSLLWVRKDAQHAEADIDGAKQAFFQSGNQDVWLFHKAQFLARRKPDEAKVIMSQITNENMRALVNVTVSRQRADAGKAQKILAQRLAEDFTKDGDARKLLECCELKLRLGNYSYIAQHARELVTGIGTASALHLALEGSFKNKSYELCLSLLQDYASLFRDSVLPPNLRHMRAMCQQYLGDWSEATISLEKAYREHPCLNTFMAYFNVLLSSNTRQCSILARDLLTLKGAKPLHLLRGATVARLYDIELAKKLWRLANRQRIKNPKQAILSLDLAYQLGIPNEAQNLHKRLFNLALKGRGPLQAKSFDEMTALMRGHREALEKNTKIYEQGTVPIHMLFEWSNNYPLVMAYHENLDGNRKQTDLTRAAILFARNGARSVVSEVPETGLHADVSSLILAAHVGILDKVESHFKHIYISPHTTQSLIDQITWFHRSQPDRQESQRKFLDLVRTGSISNIESAVKITVVDADVERSLGKEQASLLEHARREKGIILHDGPFLAEDGSMCPVELPAELSIQIIAPNLLQNSIINSTGQPARIADGTVVCIPHSVIGSFPAEIIEVASRRFRLVVTSDAVRQLEREVAAHEHGKHLADWTQALLARVQNGIASGVYHVLCSTNNFKNSFPRASNTLLALADLLLDSGILGGTVWCDDRLVTRYLRAGGGKPVVGILEILNHLNQKGALGCDELFNILLGLRQSNVRYLPLADGELMHYLERAEIRDGILIETPPLAIIRRYINACMLDKERLQPFTVDANNNIDAREHGFLVNLRQATTETIQAIWQDEKTETIARAARADWVYDSIYFDIAGIRQALAGSTNAEETRSLVMDSVGSLFTQGIGFGFRSSKGETTPRQAYFSWLETRVLSPLKKIEPFCAGFIAKVIARFVVSAIREGHVGETPIERDAARVVWAHLLHDFPEELQAALDLPADVQAEVGMIVHGVSVKFGDKFYPCNDYWHAISEAVNGRSAHVRDNGNTHELAIRFIERNESGRVVVEFSGADPKACARYAAHALPVLMESITERIRFMESRAHWFDCSESRRLAEIQRIAGIDALGDRFDALDNWRETSAEVAYRRISKLFSTSSKIKSEELCLPDWGRLMDHLRIQTAGTPGEALKKSAEALLAEEGLFVALSRHMCLPVKLPDNLEAAWSKLSRDEAAAEFERIQKQSHSLVADLHLMRLAALQNDPEMWKRAEKIASCLLDPVNGRKRFSDFQSLLKYTDYAFACARTAQKMPAWQRVICVWYHASRLHGFARYSEENLSHLCEWLHQQIGVWTDDILRCDAAYCSDTARPDNTTYGFLILHGIAHLLGEFPESMLQLGTRAKLERLLAHDATTARAIGFELSRRSDLGGNALCSFMGSASANNVSIVYGADATPLFTPCTDGVLAGYLEDMAKTPENPICWITLLGIVGHNMMPASLRPRMYEILRTVSFDGLSRNNVEALDCALQFACYQARASADQSLIHRLEEVLLGFAPLATTQAENGTNRAPLGGILLNALLILTVEPDNETESAKRFFAACRRLAELCPLLAQKFVPAASSWTYQLPFAQQANLWPFMFAMRALR